MKEIKIKLNRFVIRVIEFFEIVFGVFVVLNFLKIKKVQSDLNTIFESCDSEFGILMQGPILIKQDFTYETLRLYLHKYPNVKILLSTWNDLPIHYVKKLESLNITLLLNEKPIFSGKSNVNFQILSTNEGLNKLRMLGVKYVLKTRSDQRIYNDNNYLTYFKNIISKESLESKFINRKLVITNLNMFKNRLYTISDMFMFGKIDDISFFWDVPFQKKKSSHSEEYLNSNFPTAEGYIINNFLKKINFKPKNTFSDSNAFISSYFIVIDHASLGLFWYKYNHIFFKKSFIIDGKEDTNYCIYDQV